MTASTIIVNDVEPRRQYTATGGQTVFDFPIPFFNTGDLSVWLTPAGQTADDSADLLTITTNYTVTGENTQDGGQVTLVTPATAGDIITIERIVDIARLADYQNSGDLLAETLNKEQDTEIFISQQLRQDIQRSLQLPKSGTITDGTLPAAEALKYIRVNSAGDGFEYAAGVTSPASDVVFSPAGNISSTNTQAAIEELDSEKAKKVFDNVAAMIADTDLKIGDIVQTAGYTTKGDGGDNLYEIVAAATGTPDGGRFINITTHQAKGLFPNGLINVKQFGATGDGATDDTAAIQAAIQAGLDLDGRSVVTLAFDEYKVVDELFIPTDVVLADGSIDFQPAGNDKICINIGRLDGSELVRAGGAENVVVYTTNSTATGLTAFNFGHLARACFVNNCRAFMNNGAPPINRNHIGFSVYGIKADLAVAPGAYQNNYLECSAYNCDIGFRLDTDGYGLSGFAAEANANNLKMCTAYSCVNRALYVGEGAQDNVIEVRADTFVSSIGQGTTVAASEVRGSFNEISIREEIGSVGDTQYTVLFEGDNPRYNYVEYATQNIVTADVLFNTTGSAVGKNKARAVHRYTQPDGGDLFVVSGYSSAPASSTSTYDSVVFPTDVTLVKAIASNGVTPASYTRLYFAKAGAIDTVQRLTWDNTDAPGTIKSLDTDSTSSGTIDSRFIYTANDFIDVAVHQDGTGAQQVRWTLYFRVLKR